VSGNRQKKTDWFFVKVWKKTAENCVNYLDKGSLVLVDGVLRNNKWNDNGQEKSRLEVQALEVLFLDRKKGGNDSNEYYDGSSDVPF
jgi:single-strand DNA-binding protein